MDYYLIPEQVVGRALLGGGGLTLMQSRQLDAYWALREFCRQLCEQPDFFFNDDTRDRLVELLVICSLADTGI